MRILQIGELAALLGKKVSSVRTDMVRRRESLPPWFKLPGSRKPLWLESTVQDFVLRQAQREGALPAQDGGLKKPNPHEMTADGDCWQQIELLGSGTNELYRDGAIHFESCGSCVLNLNPWSFLLTATLSFCP